MFWPIFFTGLILAVVIVAELRHVWQLALGMSDPEYRPLSVTLSTQLAAQVRSFLAHMARRYGERTPLHEALEEKEDQLMEAQFVIVELAMENRTLKGRLDTVSKRAEMLESSIMQDLLEQHDHETGMVTQRYSTALLPAHSTWDMNHSPNLIAPVKGGMLLRGGSKKVDWQRASKRSHRDSEC